MDNGTSAVGDVFVCLCSKGADSEAHPVSGKNPIALLLPSKGFMCSDVLDFGGIKPSIAVLSPDLCLLFDLSTETTNTAKNGAEIMSIIRKTAILLSI
jgi:hypothetical protein